MYFEHHRVSRLCFKAFLCEELDDGTNYFAVDWVTDCDSSRHHVTQWIAIGMICIYSAGIPVVYYVFLRKAFTGPHTKQQRRLRKQLEFLTEPYLEEHWWFELFECMRKLSMTCIVLIFVDGQALQVCDLM